jgi:hypothetical protein
MGAREVGRYRVEDARRTDLVVALTGVVVTAGAVVTAGVVVGIPGMDAHPVRRCRVDVARLTDGDDEAGGKSLRLPWAEPHRVMEPRSGQTIRIGPETQFLAPHDEARRIAYCVQVFMNG